MKTFVRLALVLLAVTVACQAGLALAEDYYWVGSGDQAAPSASDQKAAAPEQSSCSSCTPAGCEDLCGSCCAADPWLSVVGTAGFDAFKGISEWGLQDNFGAVVGLNASVPLFALADRGFGWQLGISYGVYDWDGRSTYNEASAQQQTFVTTGFFRKAVVGERLCFGLVYDWMFNENWGAYATTPTLGQWRGQVEWAFSESNAVGVRGALRDKISREHLIFLDQTAIVLATRPVSHVDLFWHHHFESKADGFLWVGLTQDDRLSGDHSLYNCLFGASVEVPLSSRLTLYGIGQYVHPTSSAGTVASIEEGFNVGMGIAWYFGQNARNRTVHGAYGPYMPLANNSNFLVEQGVGVLPGT